MSAVELGAVSGARPTPPAEQPTLEMVRAAARRLAETPQLAGGLRRTPALRGTRLDACLGHELVFKPEGLQVTGAFKARGAANTLAWMAERGALPERVVSYSSGNHAQAVAWAAARFGVRATIYMPADVNPAKRAATESWGAEVALREDRAQAEAEAEEAGAAPGAALVPPFDHPQVICGQGTATLEAWEDAGPFDAVCVPVGGGGLMSGTVVAAQGLDPQVAVLGGEPATAADAVATLERDVLQRWSGAPPTVSDGARTLSLSPLTWGCVRRGAGVVAVDDALALRWADSLMRELKVLVEPTSALAMAAAERWLAAQERPRKVLVILSGANLRPDALPRLG